MELKNGYLITYYHGMRYLDVEGFVNKQDAQDAINCALDMGLLENMCDMITMHCIDSGDILYTEEFFLVDACWTNVHINNIMGETKVCTL